jgi:hypothetical protein
MVRLDVDRAGTEEGRRPAADRGPDRGADAGDHEAGGEAKRQEDDERGLDLDLAHGAPPLPEHEEGVTPDVR